MTKYLTAKQKAEELGITTRGLAKTRHLYKHIQKSPRKYLYFKEDPRQAVRPNGVGSSVSSVGTPKSPRTHRRRNVPYGEENYHKAPGGSGNSLRLLNQMRAKASLEGKGTEEELKSMDQALAIKIKDNHKDIVEKKQFELQTKITIENERLRREDPSYYGRMLYGPVTPVKPHRTPWTDLFPKEPDEYDRYTQEHLRDEDKKWEIY
jgi:hypothetical protein